MTIKLTPITGTYMGILGAYYLYLTVNVVIQRQKTLTSLGDGSSVLIRKLIAAGKSGKTEEFAKIDTTKYDKLVVATRSHGNFGEYVPMIGVLSLICELHGAPSGLLHVLLASFTTARVAHNSGLYGTNNASNGRKIGALVTFTTLLGTSIGSLYFSNKETIHRLIGR